MVIRVVSGLVLMSLAYAGQAGDVYVCKGPGGVDSYQNIPCQPGKQLKHATYSNALSRPPAAPAYPSRPEPPPGYRYAESEGRVAVSQGNNAAPLDRPQVNSGGIGSSAYQRGEIRGLRCTNARGEVYYARGECGTSVQFVGTRESGWHSDTVEGIPGAVMTGPNEAMDPMTGNLVQLTPAGGDRTEDVYVQTPDAGVHVNANEACRGALERRDKHPSERAQRRAQELCDYGRTLYDQPAEGGIPQSYNGIPSD